MNQEWTAQSGGEWHTWKPLLGLDPSLGETAMWMGAAVYAKMKAAGKPETICQQEAEKAAFQNQYRVRYFTK
jgi:hypothetical protein